MRRMTPRLATAALLAALALLASSGSRAADAATVQAYAYSTTGDIDGMSGHPPIEFLDQSAQGTLAAPGTFILGSFRANPLPASATLTYDNTPFTIDLHVLDKRLPGVAYFPEMSYDSDIKISGVLNGSITGAGVSSMYATVTSVADVADRGFFGEPPFPVSDIKVVLPQGIAAPDGKSAGMALLAAQVILPGFPLPAPAPEPTSIAVFAAALAGWALRKKARARA